MVQTVPPSVVPSASPPSVAVFTFACPTTSHVVAELHEMSRNGSDDQGIVCGFHVVPLLVVRIRTELLEVPPIASQVVVDAHEMLKAPSNPAGTGCAVQVAPPFTVPTMTPVIGLLVV